ncbi:Shikimate o-hydroxycinnamoyltransferase, partial [Thalictrum thalictroides]
PNSSSNDPNFFCVETLKSSLAKVLVTFYPFAGRLCADDKTGRLEIDCNGEGVLFVKVVTDSTIDEFGDFTPSMKTRKLLVPTVDTTISSCPLLLVQVTFFKCGGISLGTGIHHMVSDGASSLHFVNSWSNVTRGLDVTVVPFLDRSVLTARNPPTAMFNHTEYHRNPMAKMQAETFSSALLSLSKDQVNMLKRKANNSYSTYETIASHVWRTACVARGLDAMDESRLYITADARARLEPPIPREYLGNAIFTSSVITKVGEITSNTIEHTANKIRQAISRLDNEYLRSSLDYLEMQEDDLATLGRGSGTFPSTDLSIVSWTRLPFYEADFGWGKASFIGPATFFYGGLVYIMSSPSTEGDILIALSLETRNLAHFKKLFYQFELVANLQ